ncbi:MAG: AMP-binding protein [Rhodospirillaceae bacterium]|nr:AMP-binding protein [Rhodospirillaceae bacterium]
MDGRADQPFIHYYRSATECRSPTFGALKEVLAEDAARLSAQTKPGQWVFILSDDPLKQTLWWLACQFAGVVPGILTPLTPKLDQRKYFADLRATLNAYQDARLIIDESVDKATYESVLPPEQRLNLSAKVSPGALTPRTRPDGAPILFQQSSGTTGLRKGVVLSESVLVSQLEALSEALSLTANDRIVSWLPLYHDMGLVGCLTLAVFTATPLILTSPFVWLQDPAWLWRAAAAHAGTLAWMPNFAFNVMAERTAADKTAGAALKTLRQIISCSEPVRAASIAAFTKAFAPAGLKPTTVSSSYALAENAFAATQNPPAQAVKVEVIDKARLEETGRAIVVADGFAVASSGRAIANTSLRIVNAKGICTDGELGEVQMKGGSLFSGYAGIGQEVAPFTEDGWYKSGDYGYMRGGELFVLNRIKDTIIRAGRNIDPIDLEEIASSDPEIKGGRVVAFGIDNAQEGTEDVVVLAEFAGLRVSDLDAIAARIQERIAAGTGIAVQKVEVLRDNWLVKSSSGKISRASSRAKYLKMLDARTREEIVNVSNENNLTEDEKDAFRTFGSQSKIRAPARIVDPSRISIGNWVSFGRYGKLAIIKDFRASKDMIEQHYPGVKYDYDPDIFGVRNPFIKVGDGTSIGDFFFIACANYIEFGKHVLVSDRLFVSDSNHIYDNPDLPIALQSNDMGKPIIIEDHCWIGINVVILQGVRVGKHSVISSGAVITEDVPPYTVVAGNPARVVKKIGGGEAPEAAPAARALSTDELGLAVAKYLAAEIGRPVRPDESLFRSGLLDSLKSLRLFVFLEERLHRPVDSQKILGAGVDTINALSKALTG